MSNPRFDLVDIAQTLHARRKMLLLAVIVAAMLGGIFYLVGKKKYEAEASYIISNPLYVDRNNMFRTRDSRLVDYFGGDDDLDRVLVIAASDTLRNTVAEQLNLWEAYELKKDDPKDRLKMKDIFKDNYKMERTEYTTGKVTFEDTDPDRAAAVVNLSIELSESIFRSYYRKMKSNAGQALQERINEIDSTIKSNTLQLAAMQKDYLALGSKSSPEAMMTAAEIEQMMTVNSQLMKDKAQHISIQNEFLTGVNKDDNNRYIQVITPATPPAKPAGIGLILTVIGAAVFGFFFMAIYILIVSYYRVLIATKR